MQCNQIIWNYSILKLIWEIIIYIFIPITLLGKVSHQYYFLTIDNLNMKNH